MKHFAFQVGLLAAFFVGLSSSKLFAQGKETATVASATVVLDQIMAIPVRAIPGSLLRDAEGVAIVPDVIKLGFVVAGRRGHGVVLTRDQAGNWGPPTFITLTGGSVGWQAGLQATDVILVFKNRRSIENLSRGKFTLGGDASVAAGPVGRKASAATDAALRAEIYSYSRSRGLFAGVSLDGSVIQIDHRANYLYYGDGTTWDPAAESILPAVLPAGAGQLIQRLSMYGARASTVGAMPMDQEPYGPEPHPDAVGGALRPTAWNGSGSSNLQSQLAQSVQRLSQLLDSQWSSYLAVPQSLVTGGPPPSLEELDQVLGRFDAVAGNPQYHDLASRPEFQATHGLLKQFVSQRRSVASKLPLPPPPKQ